MIISKVSAGDPKRDPVREQGCRPEPRMPKSWVRVTLPSQRKLAGLRRHAAICIAQEGVPSFSTKPLKRFLVLHCYSPLFGCDILILIDTGAVVNILSEKLAEKIPQHLLPAKTRRVFKTADGSPLRGGEFEACLELTMPLRNVSGDRETRKISDDFYVGNITVDAIMSYEGLARQKLAVVPHWDSLLHLPQPAPVDISCVPEPSSGF